MTLFYVCFLSGKAGAKVGLFFDMTKILASPDSQNQDF